MKKGLLIITQTVDNRDSNLGFFCDWINQFAKVGGPLYIIANKVGTFSFPPNVQVFSLGKENSKNRISRIFQFWLLLIKVIPKINGTFVHMCPEYVIYGAWINRFFGKKLALWYTHKSISWKLLLAEKMVNKIFTASRESFRLASKKCEVLGHGINLEKFYAPIQKENTIKLLSIGRISETKGQMLAIEVLEKLISLDNKVSLTIVGEPITKDDNNYLEKLKNKIKQSRLENYIYLLGGKKHEDLPSIYHKHNILIHTSITGSLDKVVIEALAAGIQVVTTSNAYVIVEDAIKMVSERETETLAWAVEDIIKTGIINPPKNLRERLEKNYGLTGCIDKITNYFNK